ncbi:non-ribosomal peptide synthetase [Saccharothrix obliqua]|uniref:non-ribosomal peptide synthetase n=1 Tax=Saccharothrix obliqua TaxID=2861747 RepID=UPI001C5D5E4B|nr:non-ribosomal peptide synthetase [Saccharothrix obliqua]MBW4718810.1 non-ribosomal peptide synthetase [Saccharothrix obliqua]
MALLAAMADWARRTPRAPALEDHRGVRLDHAGLAALTDGAAARLRERGAGRGSRVALVLPRSTDLFAAELAILKAGACFAPIDPDQPADRVALLLERAAADLVITDDPARVPGAATPRVDVADLLAPPHAPLPPDPDPAGPEDPAYCLFTSGSTGFPSGVLISRAALDVYVAAYAELVGSGPGERGAQIGSPGFDVTIDELWPFLSTGASVVIASDDDRSAPHRLAAWLRAAGVTNTYVPPLLLESLFRLPAPVDLGAVRLVRTGGERLAAYPPADFPCRVLNEYGPTETVAGSVFCDVSAWRDRDIPPPIGTPLPHIRLSVRDESGAVVEPGRPGELYIGGDTVGIGYLHDAERTARRFVTVDGERCFRTGDLVRELPSGDLEFLRRLDDQVQVLGKRVEPGEVERAVNAHRGVRRAAVLAARDQHGRAGHLRCFVQWAGDPDPDGLRAHLASVLPEHMVPAEIHAVPAFPVTPAGKVDRAALARAHDRREGRPVAVDDLVRVWEEVLGVPGLAPDADFFLHGGTSHATVEVVAALSERWGRSLDVREVFTHPTPELLARLLAEEPARCGREERT